MSLLVAYIHWAINLDHTKMCCPVLMCQENTMGILISYFEK